jgi:uncharacterized protein (UPF0548 family)
MLTVRKPSLELMRRYIDAQSKLDYTYTAVGATATESPAGFVVDHTRIELGVGEAVFHNARQALKEWRQFSLGWLEAWPTDTPLEQGATVAVLARAFGIWWLNVARIVYLIDDIREEAVRFGFAYGTLPGHVETGEERFLVEWNRASGQVFYDILAFSRPRHLLARTGKWQVRRLQKRFAQHSATAMQRAVAGE